MPKRLPYWTLYAADWTLGIQKEGFDLETEGLYLRFLNHQHWTGQLPPELDYITPSHPDFIEKSGRLPGELLQFCRSLGVDHRKVRRIWSRSLSKKFERISTGWVNRRFEETRKAGEGEALRRREKAKKAAQTRWANQCSSNAIQNRTEQHSGGSSSSIASGKTQSSQSLKRALVASVSDGMMKKLYPEEFKEGEENGSSDIQEPTEE